MAIGSIYRPVLEVLREAGVDVEAALAELGLSYTQLVDGGARLTTDQGKTLGRSVSLIAGMPELGLRAAERFTVGDADLLGYVMSHSPHALAALEALSQHGRLLGDSAEFRITHDVGRASVTLGLSGGKQMVALGSDFAAGAICKLLADASGGRVRPIAVALPRQRPRRTAGYTRFFGVAVRFGAEVPTLVYDEAALRAPLVHSDAKLARILEQHAGTVAASLPPPDVWRAKVRAHIAQGLARGAVSLRLVARSCGVTERTMRRRLAEAHTSYRGLVDDVRKERALALLGDGHNVGAVAQQLGFAEATAFTRAFRRWTGALPHEQLRGKRKQQRQSPTD